MKKTIGYCLTGSFCTFSNSLKQIKRIKDDGFNVITILSYNTQNTDSRFGKAEDFRREAEEITGNKALCTIDEVEPIGPKKLLDLLIISPCTGNTLGKLAGGIYDTPVTMAAKSHLRNERPVLLGVSTNDGLRGSAKNIGLLLNSRHFYFIPMGQDDFEKKPFSVVCDFEKTVEAANAALSGRQLQPILI